MTDINKNLEPIKSLTEFIIQYKSELRDIFMDQNKRLYFRGESMDYAYNKLVPRVYRKSTKDEFIYNEYQEYYKYLRRCPEEFMGMTNIDVLSKMQHGGASTRLLDLTTNPLVALFFSCDSNFDRDGLFHVFIAEKSNQQNNGKGNILSFDSDRALMMSTIAKLTIKEQREVHNYCLKITEINNASSSNEEIRLDSEYLKNNENSSVSRFIYECERERTAFQNHRIEVADLYKMSYVKPRLINDRIKKQLGLFGIYGFNDTGLYETTLTFTIDSKSKKKILSELSFIAGIDHFSLFGGIEGLSKDDKNELYRVFVNSLNEK